MERTIDGYFNGTQIIPIEALDLRVGQRVKIILPDSPENDENETTGFFDIKGNHISAEELLRSLENAEEQIKNGEVVDGETFFKEMREKYGYEV